MKYKRFVLKGKKTHMVIEDHGETGFMAQLVLCGGAPDPNDLHSKTIVLDLFPTIEKACDAVHYPRELVGLPILK